MSLQEIYYVAEIAVGLAVILSIVFVAIELKQNTYMLRRSMADQREERINWFFETMCTDNDFRTFQYKMQHQWSEMTVDERYRGLMLGIRTLRSLLNELSAHFDGQISKTEFRNLEWNIRGVKNRQNVVAAYEYLRDGYSEQVQKFYENIEGSDVIQRAEKSVREL